MMVVVCVGGLVCRLWLDGCCIYVLFVVVNVVSMAEWLLCVVKLRKSSWKKKKNNYRNKLRTQVNFQYFMTV